MILILFTRQDGLYAGYGSGIGLQVAAPQNSHQRG